MSDHGNRSSAENTEGDASIAQSDGQNPARRPLARRRRKSLLPALLLAILVGFFGHLMYVHRDYWLDVWTTGTLTPSEFQRRTTGVRDNKIQMFGDFDTANATVLREEILGGGPPKDGIPALSNPQFLSATAVDYLKPEDRVIGIVYQDEARAYPLKILNHHEIVNDRIGDIPLAVTYCPLCDSTAVFDRRTPLGEREFGVSGLLYNSNVLMYDRTNETESLWSQLRAKGVSGPAADLALKTLPLELTSWKDWKMRYPLTKVLSNKTGHPRNYDRDPYAGYFARPQLMFPAKPTSQALPTKSRVLGVWTGDVSRAYPESAFGKEQSRVEEKIDGKRVVIEYDADSKSLRVIEADDGVQWMYSLWFAWYAFHPQTSIFGSGE